MADTTIPNVWPGVNGLRSCLKARTPPENEIRQNELIEKTRSLRIFLKKVVRRTRGDEYRASDRAWFVTERNSPGTASSPLGLPVLAQRFHQ